MKMQIDAIQLSKFLSFVLRHKPDDIGLELDSQGWADTYQLVEKGNAAGMRFSRDDLMHVVETSDKKRFSISPDGTRIRAAQGHSMAIELGLMPEVPPNILFHGTAEQFLDAILAEGLKPQSRRQVHLSEEQKTAHHVGKRHGKPVVLRINAAVMHANGFAFFRADNAVWLTDQVPKEFVEPVVISADSAITSRQPNPSR